MFGHQNDVISQDQKADASVPLPEETINDLTNAPATSSSTDSPEPPASVPAFNDDQADQSRDESGAPKKSSADAAAEAHAKLIDGFLSSKPAETLPNFPVAPSQPTPGPAPVTLSEETEAPAEPVAVSIPERKQAEAPAEETPSEPEEVAEEPAVRTGEPSNDELLKIKQDALEALSPLVGQLDLSPEDKFRTVMMLIQASDNHELVTSAYEIAQQIEDEKVRAQALLDIVNEINYFTQNAQTEER